MTLLIAMLRANDAILLADRRISRQGRVIEDEYNKICVLFCKDAKIAIAFTGVATTTEFDTSAWIAATIGSATAASSITAIIESLRSSLAPTMRSLGLRDCRLTVLCVGYVYWTKTPEPRIYEITNVADDGAMLADASLRVYSPSPALEPVVEIAGASSAVPSNTLERLRVLLRAALPPQDVLRFAVRHLRNASRSAASLGSIGEQCNSAILNQAADTVVTSTYHSARNTNRAYSANVVIAGSTTSMGAEMASSYVLAGPVIRPKDACWCGSGVSFGQCHLKKFGSVYSRVPPFRVPLPMLVAELRESSWPSGRYFAVSSTFS